MSLKQILEEKPEKKEMISKNLIEMVRNCMKKDIINLDLVHTALLQALQISANQGVEVFRLCNALLTHRNWYLCSKNRFINWYIPRMELMLPVSLSPMATQKIEKQ